MSDNLAAEPDVHDPFEIDPRALDVEWRRQPGMARDAGRREAAAKEAYARAKASSTLAHARAKAHAEVTFARLRHDIASRPEAYGLKAKATKDDIDACVGIQQQVVDAGAAVLQAKYDADVAVAEAELEMNTAAADVTAYVDRRKALERLVDLLSMDYHTGAAPVSRHGRPPENQGVDFTPKSRRTEPNEE